MPPIRHTTQSRRVAPQTHDSAGTPAAALVIIDDAPLKSTAWGQLHAARKRQEKAARDLHRHEQCDRPAYDAWLHRTFPTLVTQLRDLHQEVFAKGQRVDSVLAMAAMTGRPARKVWQEQKAHESRLKPPGTDQDEGTDDADNAGRNGIPDDEDDFFEQDPFSRQGARQSWDEALDSDFPRGPQPSTEARDVYRRLVQRLHPDRGGEWVEARQRLWHEVQLAWAAGDADWLMRLEVEWEAAHDVLSPTSPLGRLLRAIEEVHAARRDTESKLRKYRASPPWRFTLAEKKREDLRRRTEMNFQHDITYLQRQLTHLNATIASWEERPRTQRRARSRDPYAEVHFGDLFF